MDFKYFIWIILAVWFEIWGIFSMPVLTRVKRLSIPREFQNLNIENYLKNPRAVAFQMKCIIYDGPCDRIGQHLKIVIPELLQNKCRSCDPIAAKKAGQVVQFIQTNYPREWGDAVRKLRLIEKTTGNKTKPEDVAHIEKLIGVKLNLNQTQNATNGNSKSPPNLMKLAQEFGKYGPQISQSLKELNISTTTEGPPISIQVNSSMTIRPSLSHRTSSTTTTTTSPTTKFAIPSTTTTKPAQTTEILTTSTTTTRPTTKSTTPSTTTQVTEIAETSRKTTEIATTSPTTLTTTSTTTTTTTKPTTPEIIKIEIIEIMKDKEIELENIGLLIENPANIQLLEQTSPTITTTTAIPSTITPQYLYQQQTTSRTTTSPKITNKPKSKPKPKTTQKPKPKPRQKPKPSKNVDKNEKNSADSLSDGSYPAIELILTSPDQTNTRVRLNLNVCKPQ